MAERDGAPAGVDVGGGVGEPQVAQRGEGLAGERLVELDDAEIADAEAKPRQRLASRRGRGRADAHDARRHPGRGGPRDTRERLHSPNRSTAAPEAGSGTAAPSFRPESLPAVTVPPVRNGVGSVARAARVVPARGCSSR